MKILEGGGAKLTHYPDLLGVGFIFSWLYVGVSMYVHFSTVCPTNLKRSFFCFAVSLYLLPALCIHYIDVTIQFGPFCI